MEVLYEVGRLTVRDRNKDDLARDLQIEKFKNMLLLKQLTLKEYLYKLGEKIVKKVVSKIVCVCMNKQFKALVDYVNCEL